MEILKFKTNIKCSGCIETVTPKLNETVGANNWQVDVSTPEKILTVEADTDEKTVIKAVNDAGFNAEKI